MKITLTKILTLTGILAALGGCTKHTSKNKDSIVIELGYPKGEALATVGNITLTLEELSNSFLSKQGTFAGAKHLNTERKRKEFVENQAYQEAMLQEAIELGYFNDPKTKNHIKKIVVQKLVRDKLDALQKEYEPTTAEMQEHYNKNLNLYKREEALKFSYILMPPVKDKVLARKLAADMHNDIVKNVKHKNWRDGTNKILLTPFDLLERLVAIIPPPRKNQIRYNGFFAPNSKLRKELILLPKQKQTLGSSKKISRPGFAKLMARVFEIDVLRCPRCSSKMQLISFIKDPQIIKDILHSLKMATAPPEISEPATHILYEEQDELFFDDVYYE